MTLRRQVGDGVRKLVRRAGYDLIRLPRADDRYAAASYQDAVALPPGAAAELRADAPRLIDLRERYARSDVPMAQKTMWKSSYLDAELDLSRFRGDNSYLWQYRNVGGEARRKYYLYLRDVQSRDPRHLLDALDEDGLFGCWTFEYPGFPTVSRDLLDSINEIYFLDRRLGVLDQAPKTVLDIGAGYGRLAHRFLTACPGIEQYICLDAVAESTFLCEYYMRFRGLAGRAEVVPLDEIDARVAGRAVDLAVNIHSFSEMSAAAIEGWLGLVARLQVPWLLIVPNDDDQLLTYEDDGRRRDFSGLLEKHGYVSSVVEPVFEDATMCQLTDMNYHFFLYRRAS